MVPADRPADKPAGVPPQFEIRLLSGAALRLRIVAYDGLYRKARDSGDHALADHYMRLLDLAWGEVRHRQAEKLRRRPPEAFDCNGCGDARPSGR